MSQAERVVLVAYDAPCPGDPQHQTTQHWEKQDLIAALAEDRAIIWCDQCSAFRKASPAERDKLLGGLGHSAKG